MWIALSSSRYIGFFYRAICFHTSNKMEIVNSSLVYYYFPSTVSFAISMIEILFTNFYVFFHNISPNSVLFLGRSKIKQWKTSWWIAWDIPKTNCGGNQQLNIRRLWFRIEQCIWFGERKCFRKGETSCFTEPLFTSLVDLLWKKNFFLFFVFYFHFSNAILAQFDSEKMGDSETMENAYEKFDKDINEIRPILMLALESYQQSIRNYSDSMETATNGSDYIIGSKLQRIHLKEKNEAIDQVCFVFLCDFNLR